MKATVLKSVLGIAILSLIVLGIAKAPKGNGHIQWEKVMIESGQMKIEKSQYFTKVDGVLKLK